MITLSIYLMKDLSTLLNKEVVKNMSSNEIRLILSGLTCANCANKIETKVNNMNGVKEATLNFTTSTLIIELNGERHDDDIILEAKSIINKLEPGVKVFNKNESNIIPKEVNKCTSDTCSIENKNEKKIILMTKIILTIILEENLMSIQVKNHMNTHMNTHMIIRMGTHMITLTEKR